MATGIQVVFDCAEPERLAGAGATRRRVLAEPGIDHYAVVMQDPEGNEFCLH